MSNFTNNHNKWINRMRSRKVYYANRRKERIVEAKAKAETRVQEELHDKLLPEAQREMEGIREEAGIRYKIIQRRKENKK